MPSTLIRAALVVVLIQAAGAVSGDDLFPDDKVFGDLSVHERYGLLLEMGEDEAAAELEPLVFAMEDVVPVDRAKSQPPPYEHTEHQIGVVARSGSWPRRIDPASAATPDATLERIDIRLDALRVFDYPGRGTHQVLFTFRADNQVGDGPDAGLEEVLFSQVYEAEEGEGAAVTGYPVFLDLNVGRRGVAFQGATINVQNEDDARKLGFLSSGPARQGLSLLSTAQPALAPFVELGVGLGKLLLGRRRNVKVQEFFVGLDLDRPGATGARLLQGSYVVVQAPNDRWDWTDWVQKADGSIVSRRRPRQAIPFNYVIFRLQRSP